MFAPRASKRQKIPVVRSEAALLKQFKHAPMPDEPRLMLCTPAAEAFDDPDWIFEPKLAGVRAWCRWDGKELTLLGRDKKPRDAAFPEIAAELRQSLKGTMVLDGQIVVDEAGRLPAFFSVFDLLYLNGYDLTDLPLEQRKLLLKTVVNWSNRLRYTPGTLQLGKREFEEACRLGGRGIVGKRLQSMYVPGRSRNWVKINCPALQDTKPSRVRRKKKKIKK
jgi:ATP-dependent DNA ligase